MTQNKKHHQPYRNTPPQAKRAPANTAAEEAATARFGAITYLNRRIGGQWRWDASAHTFNADFVPAIASAIQQFLQPVHVVCGVQPLERTQQTRLSLTTDQLAAVQCAPFLNGAKPLAEQYRQMMVSSMRGGRSHP